LAGFFLAALLVGYVCYGQDSTTQSKADATWAFWEAFNQAAVSGNGIEVLGKPAWKGQPSANQTLIVLQDIIAGERARSRKITQLAVLNVDPGLVAYAADVASAQVEQANLLSDYVALVQKQEAITSGPVLGVGLLFNLLNHSDDKEDGILWRSVLDTGRQTADRLDALKEPAQSLEARARAVRDLRSRLATDELKLRSSLAQSYGREFPSGETYAESAAHSGPEDRTFNKREIMRSLIGQSIGSAFDEWSFESPREFQTFQIVAVQNPGKVRKVYEVKTHVKGIRSGQEHDFHLNLTYGWLYTRWMLVEIQQLN
jgi:hypothetical protein